MSRFVRGILVLCFAACGARTGLDVPEDGGEGTPDVFDAAFSPILAVDGEHACYRRASGELVCWGHGPNGEYEPDGGRPTIATPQHVVTNGVPIAIAAHITNNTILLADGTIEAWGFDDGFQRLGDGSGQPKAPPGVSILSGATELIPNPLGDFACARTTDGSIDCWGYPPACTSTFPDAGYPATPALRTDLKDLASLVLGQQFICGTNNGAIECCGNQGHGVLGDGVTATGYRDFLAPVKLPSDLQPVHAYTGLEHACAVMVDATAWCWGWNSDGQLGSGTVGTDRPVPVVVSGLSNIAQLALGFHHSCARLADGTARCWGANMHGQLGDGTTVQHLTPTTVVSANGSGVLSGIVDLHAGWDFSCALLSSGEVDCWGWNEYGQLGDGTTVDRYVPTRVIGLP